MAESVSLSRPASLSRTSRNGSTKSRSLIKKNIEMQDLNPADLLIERFTAWKIIVKQLVSYFEGVADIENNTAREMTKLAGVIQVPFRSGNQFLGEGGLQDVFYGIRDKTRQIADSHADLGRTIDSSIVQHLQKLLVEVKAHLKNVQNDTAKLAANVAREREISTRLIGELANDISAFRNTPMSINAKTDPYIANQAVAHQLQKQVLEENLLQKSIIMMQQNSAHFEEGIVRAIQSAWQTFDEWQSRASASNQEIYRSLSAHLASLPADREWISFAARSDHLLDPETPLRDPAYINYPCKDDPSVIPLHTGRLERKRRFTRSYDESYFVLTPAGFLHAFNSSDPSHPSGHGLTPTFSLFLPVCTLGPPSAPGSKSHKFHIEGRKDGTGTTKSGSLRGLLGGDNSMAWSFRARSKEEMMEWWNDIRMLCARYLIASEQIERNGPVEAAVRAAGYQSEEDEGEFDGSSVEEEVDEGYHEAVEAPAPLEYSYEKGYQGAELGPHGYAVEKKLDPGYDTNGIHNRTIRQQEKAPEGQAPYTYYEERAEVQGDGAVIDQDAGPTVPQSTGAAYNTSTRAPKVNYIRGTGYIPEGLGRGDGYVGHEVHDSRHVQQTAGNPQIPIASLPQTNDAPQTASPSPQPGIQRATSPRAATTSSTQGLQSPRQGALSPQGVSPSPRHGSLSPHPAPLSPHEATSSPVLVAGTTASPYASPTPRTATYGYRAPVHIDDGGPAPVEVSYSQEQ